MDSFPASSSLSIVVSIGIPEVPYVDFVPVMVCEGPLMFEVRQGALEFKAVEPSKSSSEAVLVDLVSVSVIRYSFEVADIGSRSGRNASGLSSSSEAILSLETI